MAIYRCIVYHRYLVSVQGVLHLLFLDEGKYRRAHVWHLRRKVNESMLY